MPTTKKRAMTKKTTRKTARRKAKKPKIALSARKVYLLSGVIVFLCAVSLVCSVLFANHAAGSSSVSAPAQSVVQESASAPVVAENATAPQQKISASQQKISTVQQKTTATQQNATAVQQKTSAVRQNETTAQQKTFATQQNATAVQQKSSANQQKTTSAAKTIAPPSPSNGIASAKPDKTPPAPAQPQPTEIKSPFAIPPAKNGATLVFVIDDAGLHLENVKKYTALPFPIAIAVLPRLSQSKECAAEIRRAKKELMLHQPMQAHTYPGGKIPDPGPGAILPDMSTAEIALAIKQNLDELGPDVKGFNNHEGSLITENGIKMGAVLEVALEREVYFVDSRTTSHSAVPQAALERDMRYLARFAPFLDNKIDRDAMLSELYKGLAVANKDGYAIIIGHVDKSVHILPQLLTEIYPYLVQQGYHFATPSMLR